jgi:hypothetical protein
MLPGVPEMLPGAPEMLPARPEILPASAADDIAKVKSEAQRIDLKRFMLFLLVSSSYLSGALVGGLPLAMSNSLSSVPVINLFGLSYLKARAIELSIPFKSLKPLNLNWLAGRHAEVEVISMAALKLSSTYTD